MDEEFLSNKPIYNLSSENDLFGNLEKSSFIVDFINNNIDYVRKNNIKQRDGRLCEKYNI